jgi:hypothetical protein
LEVGEWRLKVEGKRARDEVLSRYIMVTEGRSNAWLLLYWEVMKGCALE